MNKLPIVFAIATVLAFSLLGYFFDVALDLIRPSVELAIVKAHAMIRRCALTEGFETTVIEAPSAIAKCIRRSAFPSRGGGGRRLFFVLCETPHTWLGRRTTIYSLMRRGCPSTRRRR